MNIANLFGSISDALTAFMDTISNGVGSVLDLFWTTGEGGGPTTLGVLVLAALGVGLAWTVFRLIRGAIKGVTKSN